MASVTLRHEHRIRPTWSDTADEAAPVAGTPTLDVGTTFTYSASPSAALHMKRLYSKTLSFSGSTPQTVDLDNFVDQVAGAASAMAAVKFMHIKNTSTSGTITVSGDWFQSVFPSCTGIVLQPGQSITVVRPDTTGMVVTASSADELILTPSAGGTALVVLAGK